MTTARRKYAAYSAAPTAMGGSVSVASRMEDTVKSENGFERLPCGHTDIDHRASMAFTVMEFIKDKAPGTVEMGALIMTGLRLGLAIARLHPSFVTVLDDDIAIFTAHAQPDSKSEIAAMLGMGDFAEELCQRPVIKAGVEQAEAEVEDCGIGLDCPCYALGFEAERRP